MTTHVPVRGMARIDATLLFEKRIKY